MNTNPEEAYSVLCVDDNAHVADALRVMFIRSRRFRWAGWMPDATELSDMVCKQRPSILLLDLDMPGPDPLQALQEIPLECRQTKAVIFSAHMNKYLISRAIDAGAWGYVSKNEGEQVLLETVENVLRGEFTLSPQARSSLEI